MRISNTVGYMVSKVMDNRTWYFVSWHDGNLLMTLDKEYGYKYHGTDQGQKYAIETAKSIDGIVEGIYNR